MKIQRRKTGLKCVQKIGGPNGHIRALDGFQTGRMPAPAFNQGHFKSGSSSLCHFLDVIGVDQQGVGHVFGRTSKTGKDQHSRIPGILRCYVFLGDQIHTIRKRRNKTGAGKAIKPRKLGTVHRPVNISDWGPVELRELAVDMSGNSLKFAGPGKPEPVAA